MALYQPTIRQNDVLPKPHPHNSQTLNNSPSRNQVSRSSLSQDKFGTFYISSKTGMPSKVSPDLSVCATALVRTRR